MQIEVFLDGQWRHAADLAGAAGSRHGAVRLSYSPDYAADHLFASDLRALSVRLPVDFGEREYAIWPSFLIDLLPQGAARRRIERAASGKLTEWDLLRRGAFNPVGNLRVVPDELPPALPHAPFALEQMIRRADEFLDYAAGVGAAVTGATDTQGEAPKFWIVQDAHGNFYPDDGRCDEFAVKHFLLKFPVPEAGPNALRILRNEAAYQRVARAIGIRTTDDLPQYIDGALLVPRFDRRGQAGNVVRSGVESLYSVAGVVEPGQPLRHDQVLIELARVLTGFDHELREYVWRDLLNLALGNRDNHGRNMAILKDTDGTIRLAPIFDVGPSFLDARAITRVVRWDGEQQGRLDWSAIIDRIGIRAREANVSIDTQRLACALGDFGDVLHTLPQLLRDCDVDAEIIDQRAGNIEQLATKLAALPRSEMSGHAPSAP